MLHYLSPQWVKVGRSEVGACFIVCFGPQSRIYNCLNENLLDVNFAASVNGSDIREAAY